MEALATRHGAASERPALRPDLVIRRKVWMGDTAWLVKNPDTQKLYSFEAAMWDLIELFDGTRTKTEILEAYNATHSGEGIGLQLVLDFEEQLREMGLIAQSARERSLALLEGAKTARKRAAEEKAEGFNPFFIQWKVVDPDRFLARTAKYVRWIWSPPVVIVGLVCFALTIGVFVRHFGTLWDQTLELYAFLNKPFWDAIHFFVILTCIGAIHEFSHGYVTKFYGGEVHDIGMALFYFTPAFYCDTTDAFLFESKWHKVWVTVAGIYVEALDVRDRHRPLGRLLPRHPPPRAGLQDDALHRGVDDLLQHQPAHQDRRLLRPLEPARAAGPARGLVRATSAPGSSATSCG